jgi:JmjC domain
VLPQSASEFISSTYEKTWTRIEGNVRRFSDLADWGTLDSLLATHRFETPRFRVAKGGEVVPVEGFTEEVETRGKTLYRRIVADRLLGVLRDGATLTVDRIDQAHQPVRDLAAALQLELKAQVFVNMFASWMPVPGFDTHWDDHDVFVIQLSGRKHWRIYEPIRPWPLYRDVGINPKPDENAPTAEFDLAAGDVLYLPHGWWHSVSAVAGPSLHLTVGVSPDNGIDLLTWLVDRARADDIFRRRIPRFSNECEQAQYLLDIRQRWNELMATDDIMSQFLAYADGTSPARPLFGFPEIFSENGVLDRKDARIVLLAPRVAIEPTKEGFVLVALGRRWAFPNAVKPLIDATWSLGATTVRDVIAASKDLSEEQTASVIFTLLRAGVITIRDDTLS